VADNNVKVNWIIDTKDVERAKQILAQADQVGNKFQQTAANTGKAVAQGYSAANASLLQMRQQLERLQFRIENTAQSDKKRLSELSNQYKTLDSQIQKATKSLYDQEKAIKATAVATKSTAVGFGDLYNAFKLVLAAGIVRELGSAALEAAKLAGNVEGVSRAFDKMPNSVVILQELRHATRDTVADFELMKQALQARNFGLPVRDLAKLLEFATVKAQQTGLSIDYITNSLVTGLGRKSERVFDNLQLDIAELRRRIATGLDFREAGIQLVIEDLERMGGVVETSATDVDQLSTAFEELKLELSQKITGGTWIDTLTETLKGFKLLVEGLPTEKLTAFTTINPISAINFIRDWKDGVDKAILSAVNLERATQELVDINKQLTGSNREQADMVAQELIFRLEQNRLIDQQIDKTKAKIQLNDLENKGSITTAAAWEKANMELQRMLKASQSRIEINRVVISELRKLLLSITEIVKKPEVGLIEEKLEQIKDKADSIKTAQSRKEIHDLSNELAILKGELADLEAFGTTKQFLEVNGQVKLVPIEEYKIKQYKVQTENEIGELEVKTKLVLAQNPAEATEQLEAEIQKQMDAMRFTIPTPAPDSKTTITAMSEWQRIGQAFADNWKTIVEQGIGDTANILDAAVQREADAYDQRLNQAREYYDTLITLAGDDQREKERLELKSAEVEKRLRREAFEADKRARRSQAVINGAAGITRAFATMDFYEALVAAALIAAQTASQIAVINSQSPKFAKGVIDLKGPGTKTSDSINAKLSKGESVMTADETSSSMGILKDIRAGRLNDKMMARKLDSAMLKDLKLSKTGVTYAPVMDDSRLVKKMDQLINSQPDFADMNGVLWKTRKKSDNYKQWVRAKIM
jgi:hypothetical protein